MGGSRIKPEQFHRLAVDRCQMARLVNDENR